MFFYVISHKVRKDDVDLFRLWILITNRRRVENVLDQHQVSELKLSDRVHARTDVTAQLQVARQNLQLVHGEVGEQNDHSRLHPHH